MHRGVIAALTRPVATSTHAGMETHAACSMVACVSPANIVKGRAMPQSASTSPAKTDLATGCSPIRVESALVARCDAWYTQPPTVPTRASGISSAISRIPACEPEKRGMPMPPPNKSPSRVNAPSAPAMAKRYTNVFWARGSTSSVSRPCSSSPSAEPESGATKP